jgi:tRNA modification GTPase
VRVSGPRAAAVLAALAGHVPQPRHAAYSRFVDQTGAPLDDGLALWFPGPASATGEDLAELHLHGGRAVVAAVLAVLAGFDGLRPATAGEFTRRAFEHGRIDLAQAEGLADLLAAETEAQRQSALTLAEGALGGKVALWQAALLKIAAQVEADLDFSDEGDVAEVDISLHCLRIAPLFAEMNEMLVAPPAERLRDGVRVVLAGPPNSGKSSLFNRLIGRHAAIVTDIAGTTRDLIEAPVTLDGLPLVLIDTAGLRDDASDAVEAIGIARTGGALAGADIILWLGDGRDMPADAILVAMKSDLGGSHPGLPVSVVNEDGIAALRTMLLGQVRARLPRPGALALNARHRSILADVTRALIAAQASQDLLITAEHLRNARTRLDALTGRAGVEDMLDALFGGFCIGK